jgi:hypothetical protein
MSFLTVKGSRHCPAVSAASSSAEPDRILAMRECIVLTLILLCLTPALAQDTPAAWKAVKDSRSACQIMVPPEWVFLGENSGASIFQSTTTAIAVVTSQTRQAFKPLPESLLRSLGIPKNRVFENSAKRIFYQDRISAGSEDPNAYSASVPSKSGTCSCHVSFVPAISEETARKIALSLSPLPE